MTYYYNITSEPNLETWNENNELISGLKYDILNSEMENKNLVLCMWIEKTAKLEIEFHTDLIAFDKILLDNIVSNYME